MVVHLTVSVLFGAHSLWVKMPLLSHKQLHAGLSLYLSFLELYSFLFKRKYPESPGNLLFLVVEMTKYLEAYSITRLNLDEVKIQVDIL